MTIQEFTAIKNRTLLCYQCSACNSVCPAFRIEQFSPRMFILRAVSEGMDKAAMDPTIWGCRSCGMCEICPMDIDIPAMVILARMETDKQVNPAPKTKTGHKKIFNLAQKIQAHSTNAPVLNRWPRADQKFTEKGSTVLYCGMLPIWDSLMYTYDLEFKIGLQAILQALNSVDVIPAIPPHLKDSGHDLFYSGDENDFLDLALHNMTILDQMGARTVIVVNPEDYHVLKNVYPLYLDDFDLDIQFWTDYILDHGILEQLRRQAYLETEVHACYHDPCKLGRINKIYESPRILLENIPGVRLVTLRNEKDLAPCCGVTAFIGCDEGSLYLRNERLQEVEDASCEVLVSTCPSCVSHYSCALDARNADNPGLKVMDLSTFMGRKLYKFT
ncbi:hypothetical protein GF325_10115 [Candidatus Bathyarchaeota archaeon]|nr:hypothetical protein [Candidatus Bathyarchaeota archaeon]